MSRAEDNRRIKKARDQGALAYTFGEGLKDNPWQATETRAAWERGWQEAKAAGVEVTA